ncbi:MAG: ABC transporter permease subunit [Candidatus Saliniplasma sp.]
MKLIESLKLFYSIDMWKRIISISKKEIKYNFRNRWVLFLTLLFLAFSVLVSYFGTSVQAIDDWMGLQDTVAYMATYIEYMVPILAVILGYSTISRECEDGSMELLLSYPVDRGEVLAGKFLGLWAVLSLSVVIGLGTGGVVISLMVEDAVFAEYYLFILSSVILGGVYISISMMFSVIFEDSSSAMSGSIFTLFFFTFIWLFSMYALAEVTFGWESLEAGRPPQWYFILQLFNPVMLWYTLLALNIAPMREWALEFGGKEPEIHPYDTWVMIILLLIWIAVPLLIAEKFFRKREVD